MKYMPLGERHNLSVYEKLYTNVELLAQQERRTTTNMTEILLEEALKARGVKIKEVLKH